MWSRMVRRLTMQPPHWTTREYSSKLSHASDCLQRFVAAMQKLQKGVASGDESNLEKLRQDFDFCKQQLIARAYGIPEEDDRP